MRCAGCTEQHLHARVAPAATNCKNMVTKVPYRQPPQQKRPYLESTVMWGWLCKGSCLPCGILKIPMERVASSAMCWYVMLGFCLRSCNCLSRKTRLRAENVQLSRQIRLEGKVCTAESCVRSIAMYFVEQAHQLCSGGSAYSTCLQKRKAQQACCGPA